MIPKLSSPEYAVQSQRNHIMNRPLPPLPLMQSPPHLQKDKSPKRLYKRNVSPFNLPQPIEDLRASSKASAPSPIVTKRATTKPSISPASSRRSSSNSTSDNEAKVTTRLRKRSSWLPASISGHRSRNSSQDFVTTQGPAWIRQTGSPVVYPLQALFDGQRVSTEESLKMSTY